MWLIYFIDQRINRIVDAYEYDSWNKLYSDITNRAFESVVKNKVGIFVKLVHKADGVVVESITYENVQDLYWSRKQSYFRAK